MIDIFHTIKINGYEFPRPNNVTYGREDIYGGQYTTCTGAIRADYIGARYSDITLEFDTLTDDLLTQLSSITGTTTIAFDDHDGTHTLSVIRKGFSNMPTRHTLPQGGALWKNIKVSFAFVSANTTPDAEE